ncbi:MAG: hypothetical protein KF841_15485 [Phycisphaerae bacterium]|nr:hypothetical protein [Phycisphaerae bacterium]
MSSRRRRRQKRRGGGRLAKPKRHIDSWWPLFGLGLALVGLISAYWWQATGTRSEESPVRLSRVGEILCPVGGMPIKREISVLTSVGPIYFCCKHCIDRFNAEPSAFQDAVEAQQRSMAADSQPEG